MQTPKKGELNWDVSLNAALNELADRTNNAAPASHNHDGVYSPGTHNHDLAYSGIAHNHSGVYLAISALGAAGGAAQLDGDSLVPLAQLPSLSSVYLSVAQKGAASGVASLDSGVKVPLAQIPDLSGVYSLVAHTHANTRKSTYHLTVGGLLIISTGAVRLYNDTGASWTITGVRASVTDAPTGSNLMVDVRKNGVTIYGTPSNRPTVTDGTLTSGINTGFSTSSVAAGEYLTVDVVAVGSTYPGKNLSVAVTVL